MPLLHFQTNKKTAACIFSRDRVGTAKGTIGTQVVFILSEICNKLNTPTTKLKAY